MSIQCWYYDVTELKEPRRFSAGMSALPWITRREKILRPRHENDRCLSLGTGLLAAYALKLSGAKDLSLSYTEHGKPYLSRHPDIHFNLSHSGVLAVCAVSDVPVGIDIEHPRKYSASVARRFFTSEEYAFVEKSEDTTQAFLQIWTRKESYLKMLGCGLSLSPETFSVLPGGHLPKGCYFSEKLIDGCQLCVCTGTEECLEVVRQWQNRNEKKSS